MGIPEDSIAAASMSVPDISAISMDLAKISTFLLCRVSNSLMKSKGSNVFEVNTLSGVHHDKIIMSLRLALLHYSCRNWRNELHVISMPC